MQTDGWSCFAFTAGSKKQHEPPSPAFSNLTNRVERPKPRQQYFFRIVQQLKAPAHGQQSHSNSQVRQLQDVI